MPSPLPAALVLATARAWIGTPWSPRAALRHCGADCAGLVRGIIADLTGRDLPAPPWDAEGASWGAAMLEGAREAGLLRQPVEVAKPGDVVAYRIGPRAHAGILTPGGVIHADQVAGVIEAPALGRLTAHAWSIPALGGAVASSPFADLGDLVGIVYPPEAPASASWRYEIADAFTGATLAARGGFATRDLVLGYLAPLEFAGLPVEVAEGAV